MRRLYKNESLNKLNLNLSLTVFIILILSSFGFSKSRKSTEKLDISTATKNISEKLSTLSNNGRPIRVAVVPFSSAFKDSKSNKFGEYFAERSITSIKNTGKQIKLFERNRLDAITKEHALNLSGLINQDDAIKIGELIPIDYLLTGTYSKLESYIEINGRVLDVVTGEIVQTFIQKVNLTSELVSLFPKKQNTALVPTNTAKAEDKKPACYYEFMKLKDLYKTESNVSIRIQKMTNIALKIPVNLECGDYHQYFIEYLRRDKKYPTKYIDYLYNETLNFKENPDASSLVYSILRYFNSDDVITDKEWKLGISVLKKTSDVTRSRYLNNLFTDPEKTNISIQKKRIDQLMKLISNGEISTGQPQSIDRGFSRLFSALTIKDGLSELQIHLFNKYSNLLKDEKCRRDLYRDVVKIFDKDKNNGNKQILIRWLGILSVYVEATTNNTYKLQQILEDLSEKADSSSQDSITLSLFIRTMKPSMEKLFPLLSKGNSYQSLVELCIKNNIIIKDYTPTLDQLKKLLASDNYHEKRDAALFIKAYGKDAKPIEKDVARLLRRSENLKFNGATNLQWDLLNILKNTKPTDPEIIKSVFNLYTSQRHQVPNTAIDVMATLSDPAYPILIADFNTKEPYIQIRIVKTLAKMEDQKEKAVAFIKEVYGSTKNTAVKDNSEDALIRLGAL